MKDVRLATPAQVRLMGKGRKVRSVPLMSSVVELLAEYVRENGLDDPARSDEPLFRNRRGQRLSRWGVRHILNKYCNQARPDRPSLHPRLSPHCFRHSKAMHLAQSGCSPVVIRDILGHADIQSTSIYARADLEMKRRALEKTNGSPIGTLPPWQRKPALIEWLRSL